MIERQKTETVAQTWAVAPELVRLELNVRVVDLAPAEARQLAQELLDAADQSEEPPPAAPVQLHPVAYDDLPLTAIAYDEGA
ncbi:hypothetical protein ASF48_05075 [Rathayibacter sp. Leaf299]|uniref:hypothetical protein n=1 Tax=Rathayibacter sp. Leaf299 TaxID=1736328 RepID=UPI0006FD5F91|nr:hypothetical protein [Rathayibacter sp. Leaf299]KQQ22558.1 hypothetical protein ASF48_05075 [Rathayibacter sp. Leaf299]